MTEIEKQDQCLNCSTILREEDVFCPACGQKKLQAHDFTFRHLAVDSVGDYFHFDGKFYRTVKSLLLHPGAMTNDFLAGRRARYIQPFKLFLFISVVYFLLFGMTSMKHELPQSGNVSDTLKEKETLNYSITLPDAEKMTIAEARTAVERMGEDALLDSIMPNSGWFTRFVSKKFLQNAMQGNEKLTEKLFHNASKIVFILIPVMALLLKLLYIRKKKLYFDHLIFALHLHALIFLGLIMNLVFDDFTDGYFMAFLFPGMLLYLLLSLKRVYLQAWGRTILKFLLLFFGYLILALPVFAIVLALVSFLF